MSMILKRWPLLTVCTAFALLPLNLFATLALDVDTSTLPVGGTRMVTVNLEPSTGVTGAGVMFEFDPAAVTIPIAGVDFGSFGGPTQAVHMVRIEPGRMVFAAGRYDGASYTASSSERVVYFSFTRQTLDPFTIAVSNAYLGTGGTSFSAQPLANITFGDTPEDSDGDGLPDWWEMLWFGNLETANATSDFTGDGILDIEHYLAGTNPRIPYLKTVPELVDATFEQVGTRIVLSFPTDDNARYRLQRNTSLMSPFWETLFFATTPDGPVAHDLVVGTGGLVSLFIEMPDDQAYYFRLQASEDDW